MAALLRFSGATEQNPVVDEWLDVRPGELGSVARAWFTRMRQCGPDVREIMHDGYATVLMEDAPFAYVGVFKTHVKVGFFHGAVLPDPARLLEGAGKSMRHVKIRPGQTFGEALLDALITASYWDIVARLRVGD